MNFENYEENGYGLYLDLLTDLDYWHTSYTKRSGFM